MNEVDTNEIDMEKLYIKLSYIVLNE